MQWNAAAFTMQDIDKTLKIYNIIYKQIYYFLELKRCVEWENSL